MIKISHIADLHIGSNQYGLSTRRTNQKNTLLKLASELKKYDVCLIAGDVFDSPSPSPDDISLWVQFTKTINSDGCIPVANVGNHDKLYDSSRQWVDLSPFIGKRASNGSNELINSITVKGITINYLDHTKRRDLNDVVEKIPASDILMMHQSCAGFMSSIMRPEIDEDLLNLISQKAKYIALGDLHIHKVMKVSKNNVIGYPGNIDFLRLCDPYSDFKYLELEIDKEKIKSLNSVSFEPTQKTQVIKFSDSWDVKNIISQDPEGFYIFRYFAKDYEMLHQELEELNKVFPNLCFYLYREKLKSTKDESSQEVSEDTDFMSLVKKENFLEDRDLDLISDLWSNSSVDNVEEVLRKDLENQINANN
jgi:DNA repair exonuclease SbcCD nuclease subunit